MSYKTVPLLLERGALIEFHVSWLPDGRCDVHGTLVTEECDRFQSFGAVLDPLEGDDLNGIIEETILSLYDDGVLRD